MHFAVLLFLAFAIACGGKTPTAPDTASLRFTPRVPEPGVVNSVTAEAGQGQIAVRSILSGQDPCRTLGGEPERRCSLRSGRRPVRLRCSNRGPSPWQVRPAGCSHVSVHRLAYRGRFEPDGGCAVKRTRAVPTLRAAPSPDRAVRRDALAFRPLRLRYI